MKLVYPSSLTQPQSLRRVRWSRWLIGLLLALGAHLLILLNPGLFLPKATKAPRVDLTEITPDKLNAIRKQWQEKPLLLNTDPNAKDPNAKAPEDARYESDRNKRVEREQRARVTNVIPKSGSATGDDAARPGKAGPKTIPIKNLSNFKLKASESPSLRSQRARARAEESPRESGENGAQAAGGDQALDDPSLPEGDQNMLSTQESKYYSFYSRIFESIGPVWQSLARQAMRRRNFAPGKYVTFVDVVLDSEGNYRGAELLQGSGEADFDRIVDEAWRKISRFPNPPKDLQDASGNVHLKLPFTITIYEGANLFVPPTRAY